MADEVARKMAAIEWSFGEKDPEALSILEQRIAETGQLAIRVESHGDHTPT